MAKKKYEESNIQAIADTIRDKTGTDDTYDTSEMASGVDEVYEAGRKSQYDEFWDDFLKDSRENKASVPQGDRFAGSGWNDDTFYPPQDIYVKYGYRMFFYNRVSNIKQRLEDCGVQLIFDGCNDVGCMFEGCSTTEIPVIELNKTSNKGQTQRLCYACKNLVTIEKIIADEANLWGNSFGNCPKLANILFDGVIGTSISFSSSPLTVESMKSVITHLKDYSGTTDEFKYSLILTSACKTALTAEGATSPNGNLWTEYVDDLGWNLV